MLASDLSLSAVPPPSGNPAAININSSDVVLDLKGHTLSGPGTEGSIGILVHDFQLPPGGTTSNVTVRGGIIKDFRSAIRVYTNQDLRPVPNITGVTIADLRLLGPVVLSVPPSTTAISVEAGTAGTIVRNCFLDNWSYGIYCLDYGNDTFHNNFFTNIWKFGGALIISTIFNQQNGMTINASSESVLPTP